MINLFSQINIKGHVIRNRVVLPPMVCFGWSDEAGIVSESNVKHYEKRAEGGTGLIVVEATCVTKEGRLAANQLGIWSDDHIEGLEKIAKACHEHNSKAIIQIHHGGLSVRENISKRPLAPSNFKSGTREAFEMTREELRSIQLDFVNGAIRAEKAGFDGIELHGAHGYLICQFMSSLVNKREDEYGGTLENRARFALEIIAEIKAKVKKDFIIGYRMGGNEPTLKDGIEIAKLLEKGGVDLLHVSAGMNGSEVIEPPKDFNYNYIVYMGTEIKKHVNIPVIVVNNIKKPSEASYLIENNLADLVAIGRGMLVDAEWANKAKNNEDVKECIKCSKCQWWVNGKLCPQNK